MVSPCVIEILNFGSFPGKILFTSGYGYDEICKELKKQKCHEWLQAFESTKWLWENKNWGFASSRTLSIKGEDFYYNFLCLKNRFDFSDTHHAKLSHEVIHICSFHLHDVFDVIKENEAFAYTHTHILNQCYKVLRNKK